MKIKSITLENFRSWEKYSLEFKDITILIGQNGMGKTNILEAVWLLADGRSWRTKHDTEVIQWGKDYARIVAEIENSDSKRLEMFLQYPSDARQTPTKNLKINDVKKRILDLLGEMPAVLFSPESIEMVDGAPALRRRFLDILLSQTNKKYVLHLIEYQKVLRERNRLLWRIKTRLAKVDELDFWDVKLTENGEAILKERKAAIKFFNKNLSEIYADISGKDSKMKLAYKETVTTVNFSEHLAAVREREIEQAATLYGPHRDDFEIHLGDRDLKTFGSRGEFRSAILALKSVELKYLESIRGEKPILLLDDIFSELDSKRRAKLAKIIQTQQTLITTTDLDHINKDLRTKAKIVEIK